MHVPHLTVPQPRARIATSAALLLAFAAALAPSPAAQDNLGEVSTFTKISDTVGGFSATLDNGDEFGFSGAALGDLDGDGNPDVAIGAPGDDDGAGNAGAVYILFLNADRTVKSHHKISGLSGDISAPSASAEFGYALAPLGDLDGDGVIDLAVGEILGGPGIPGVPGAVRVLRLDTDGTVKSEHIISAGLGGFPAGPLQGGDAFGSSVAVIGDVDDDGIDDWAVGAWSDDDGDNAAGALYIMFMNADETVGSVQKISDTAGNFTADLFSLSSFGDSVAPLGDLNDDGVPDVACGAGRHFGTLSQEGSVFILLLESDGTVQSHHQIDTTTEMAGFTGQNHNFGYDMAGPGDLDGDGNGDLYVGTRQNDRFYTLLLADDGTPTVVAQVAENVGGFTGDLDIQDGFSTTMSLAGDLDGDGVMDLVAGAFRDDDGGTDRGAVYILAMVGPPEPEPIPSYVSSLLGRSGRATLIKPSGSDGDEAILEPVVIIPDEGASCVFVGELIFADAIIGVGETFNFGTGDFPTQAAQSDGDNNGFDDIFTANTGGDSFSYLPAQDIPGEPPFDTHVEFALPNDGAPVAIATADFNNDGNPDVVVAGDGGVTIFLGNGAGNFTAAGFAPVTLLSDLAVGFVNGDANLDVVTASAAVALGSGLEQGFATVLLGDGAGNLTNNGTFATGQALASVLLADTDGDSDIDALVATHQFDAGPGGDPQGTLTLHLGDGAGGFTPSGVFAGFAMPAADGIHPTSGAVGDINNDTFPDFVYADSDNVAFAPDTFADEHPPIVLTILLNDQAGGFAVSQLATPYAGKGVAPILEDIAPDPEDGNLDCTLVWYEDTLAGQGSSAGFESFVAVLLGDGTGSFFDPSPNQFLTGDEPGDGDAGDVNGDSADSADSGGGGGGVDLLIPNTKGDSVTILLGDGAGGVLAALTVNDVDPQDPGALPGGGVWEGGPRALLTADLGGDAHLDAVVYNDWEDTANLFSQVFASLSVLNGDGTGNMSVTQTVALARGGEFSVGDIDGDGTDDVVVTQRLGTGGTDQLLVFAGTGAGALSTSPAAVAVPGGHALSGGLSLADVVGDSGLDAITTSTNGGAGHLLVYENVAGVLTPVTHDLGTSWSDVRSVAVGDLTGDGQLDAAVGVADGRLVLASNSASGFEPLPTSSQAAAVGGSALVFGNLDGDARPDLASSAGIVAGSLDQAFVRTLLNQGPGAFGVDTLGGLSASAADGSALRPILTDLDGNGTTDMVLVHGNANKVSLLLNELNGFAQYGSGKPGKGGLTPNLAGIGYTTPGGQIEIRLTQGLGGALGVLQVGIGKIEPGFVHVTTVLFDLVLPLGGTPGQAGAGTLTLPATLPTDPATVGAAITMQMFFQDFDAGPPAPNKISASNGLELTIVD